MRLSFDPCALVPRDTTAESFALSAWYDDHPTVRRLWGVKDAHKLRVIVSVEATPDNNDVYPAWLANCETWSRELRSYVGRVVQLELIDEMRLDGLEIDAGSVVIADLFWRDPTLNQPYKVL
jgi:hypothetical protein